jgi:hypothetical protein
MNIKNRKLVMIGTRNVESAFVWVVIIGIVANLSPGDGRSWWPLMVALALGYFIIMSILCSIINWIIFKQFENRIIIH